MRPAIEEASRGAPVSAPETIADLPVIVTDGEQRAALAITRSLGAAGYPVHVVAGPRRSLAGSSRFALSETRLPHDRLPTRAYCASVAEIVQRTGARYVVPVTERSCRALLPFRSGLAPAKVPFPSIDRFLGLCDKHLVSRQAQSIGIPVPREVVLREPGDEEGYLSAAQLLTYGEVAIKPAFLDPAACADAPVRYCAEVSALRGVVGEYPAEAFPLLVQERIRGDGLGVFLLMRKGEPLRVFGHRRLREKPPSGGVSVLRESVAVPSALHEASVALLRAFEWDGVAMVEFKESAETGEPVLMEVNPRFWGSLQLAIDSGVDFPRQLLEAWGGAPFEAQRPYRLGVRSRWEWGDVDHLIARLRRRDTASGARSIPSLLRTMLDCAGLSIRNRGEVLRISDPMPFLVESRNWIAHVLSR